MRVEFAFYGTLREAAGEKTVAREVETGTTALQATRAVADEYDDVGSLTFRSDGRLRPTVSVAVNGEPVLDGDDVSLDAGDELTLAPGVSGGSTEARRR